MIYVMGLWTSAGCVGLVPALLRSGWLLSSSTVTPHRYMQIQYARYNTIPGNLILIIMINPTAQMEFVFTRTRNVTVINIVRTILMKKDAIKASII